MAANVDERPDLAVGGSHDDHRFGSQIDEHIVTRARHAGDMRRTEPVAQQHAIHVALENARVRIELPLERASRRMAVDQFMDIEDGWSMREDRV